MAYSNCANSGVNTGSILCDKSKANARQHFIGGLQITSTTTTLQADLKAASLLPKSNTSKLYPLPIIQDATSKKDANKEGNLNYGFKITLIEGKPAYEYKVFGGTSLVKQLRKLNNKTVRVFELDDDNALWGTEIGTKIVGYQAKLFFDGQLLGDAQKAENGVITFQLSILDNAEYFDKAKYFDVTSVDMTQIKALNDVQIVTTAATVANVFKLTGKITTAQAGVSLNVHDTYPTELSAAGLWVSYSGAANTTIPITSVANDVTNGGYTVTLDSATYTALASGTSVSIGLAAPSVLDAADVVDTESVVYTFLKP